MKYSWNTNRRFNAYTNYLQQHFGIRVQKLSLDAGLTCPNRDGTISNEGCYFCNNEAFTPSYVKPEKSITQQLYEGMEFHAIRYKTNKYFAYFQSYSNTYGAFDHLKRLYEEALSVDGVIGLVVGTRPDCIDEEKLNYFAQLAKQHHILIEYGVESCYDKTLKMINRGHNFATAQQAIEQTRHKGIFCGAHFVFGFPSETRTEMENMVTIINTLPLNTIKLHQLQILKNTVFEQRFLKSPEQFHVFSTLHDYVDFVIRLLERLNPEIMIERVAGEVKPETTIYPNWGNYRYDQLLQLVEKEMDRRDTWQGKKFECNNKNHI
jgi:radical SAM protein (TIGR01212 family)